MQCAEILDDRGLVRSAVGLSVVVGERIVVHGSKVAAADAVGAQPLRLRGRAQLREAFLPVVVAPATTETVDDPAKVVELSHHSAV